MDRRTALVWMAGLGILSPVAQAVPRTPFSREVSDILDLTEAQIDTGRVALAFGKEIYPHIDVDAYSRSIDVMVGDARAVLKRYSRQVDPESIIRALNTYYYKFYGIRYDNSPGARTKRQNFFLHNTLDTRQGNCLSIPMLYMAVAQRLGYPVYAVTAPDHSFVRFVDPRLKEQNIELSASAGYSPDEDYAFNLNISQKAIKNGAYLRTLSKRHYLGVLLLQNALAFDEQGDLDRAIRYLEKAEEIDPKNVYFPRNLAAMWIHKAKQQKVPEAVEKFRKIAYEYLAKAQDMGWTRDPDANTRKKS